MSNENNSPALRQQLETALDFISRSALGHDTGHCVHFANKAEAGLRCAIDALAAIEARGVEKFAEATIAIGEQEKEESIIYAGKQAMLFAKQMREGK